MNSLRSRLFVILVAATGLIWLFAACWIYIGAKQEVETVLDARLQEAARMVSSLVPSGMPTTGQSPTSSHVIDIPSYERQLACQIWSLDGQLVAKSSGAPATKFTDTRAGFSERKIDGETWRVYTIEDHIKGIRVLVGDRLSLRDHLVAELIKGLLAPTLLMIPLLGFLIWVSLSRGLRPLRSIGGAITDARSRRREPGGDRTSAEGNSPAGGVVEQSLCQGAGSAATRARNHGVCCT